MVHRKKYQNLAADKAPDISFSPVGAIISPFSRREPFAPFSFDEEDEASRQNDIPAPADEENSASGNYSKPVTEHIEFRESSPAEAKPHYEGHRQRLRERFLRDNGQNMPDYEFLELLLFRSIPRRDTKPIAKALLAEFGNLGNIFSANIARLREVAGCGESAAIDLKIIGAAGGRILRSDLPKRNIFTSWDKLIAYCRSMMAFEEREQFRVLFLDKKNGLIADEILQTGTIDHTPIYPRDVVKRALDLNASSIILAHNHPSGDTAPSKQDIAMTAKLQAITAAMGIIIHDHLIIGRDGYTSFREMKLL